MCLEGRYAPTISVAQFRCKNNFSKDFYQLVDEDATGTVVNATVLRR